MKYNKEKMLNNIKRDVIKDGMFDDFKENLYVIKGFNKIKITIDDLTYPMLSCLEEKHVPHYNDNELPRLDIQLLKDSNII